MIVRPRRRRRAFGQDDGSDDLSFLFTDPTTDPSSGLYIPPTMAVSPPTLSPIAPGLTANDLIPPAGTVSVTADGNIINSQGGILGVVNQTTGQVSVEPTIASNASNTQSNAVAGQTLSTIGLGTGVANAVANALKLKPSAATLPPAGTVATPFGNISTSTLAIGGGLLALVLIASSGGGRRR